MLPGGAWIRAYERATHAQPQNFGVWLEYLKALDQAEGWPSTWLGLRRRSRGPSAAPRGRLGAHPPHDAEGLRGGGPGAPPGGPGGLPPAAHAGEGRPLRGLPFDGILNQQVDRLGDPQLAVRFFEQILKIHPAKPPNDWLFGQILNWGQTRFAKDPRPRRPTRGRWSPTSARRAGA
ncbi:MAG: hypothetical protein U1G05_09725 [Kiritimatiellia bacterium]